MGILNSALQLVNQNQGIYLKHPDFLPELLPVVLFC